MPYEYKLVRFKSKWNILFCTNLLLLVAITFCFEVKAQWALQTSGTGNNLFSIHFTDMNNGWAVGANNTILHTTNGGTTWLPVAGPGGVPAGNSYLGVRFIDSNTGWVGGGRVAMRTEDGGANWVFDVDPVTNFSGNLFAVSSTQAWSPISGSGVRFFNRYTYSGGAITRQTFDVIASSSPFLDMFFTDIDNGWAVGFSGLIRRITNASGGSPSFAFQTSGTAQTLNGIFMLDSNTGWIAGNSGTILNTTNGGATWSPQTSGTTTNLRSVHFTSSLTGWAVGDSGLILKTTNGGTSWSPQTSGTTQTLRRVFFVNAAVGYSAGLTGTILRHGNPTSAGITIVGRVTDSEGNGLSKTTVILSGGFYAEPRVNTTDSLGYFVFDDVQANGFYLVKVSRKGFVFFPEYHYFTLIDSIEELKFEGVRVEKR